MPHTLLEICTVAIIIIIIIIIILIIKIFLLALAATGIGDELSYSIDIWIQI